jgi:predicted tellurium resistance membrane protein TerC
MDAFFTSAGLLALVTLTFLEIVLGVDNVIFISILSGKLRKEEQKRARRVGLVAAMVMRLGLLWSIVWIARLTKPLFTLLDHGISGRDLILIGGGLFLLAKATYEIHDKLEGAEHASGRTAASFSSVIIQVMLLDIVFSLDSVITAIGMADDLRIMVGAVVLAVLVMMVAAERLVPGKRIARTCESPTTTPCASDISSTRRSPPARAGRP